MSSSPEFIKKLSDLSMDKLFTPLYKDFLSLNISLEYSKRVVERIISDTNMTNVKDIDLIEAAQYFSFSLGSKRERAIEKFISQHIKKYKHDFKYSNIINIGLDIQDIDNVRNLKIFKLCMMKIVSSVIFMIKCMNKLTNSCSNTHITKKGVSGGTMARNFSDVFDSYVKKLCSMVSDEFALSLSQLSCKFGGSDGNFKINRLLIPSIEWVKIGNDFMNDINLVRDQDDPYNSINLSVSRVLDNFIRILNVISKLCKKCDNFYKNGFIEPVSINNKYADPSQHTISREKTLKFNALSDEIDFHVSVLKTSSDHMLKSDQDSFEIIAKNLGQSLIKIDDILHNIGYQFTKSAPNKINLYMEMYNSPEIILEYMDIYLRYNVGFTGVNILYDKFALDNNGYMTTDKLSKFIEGLNIDEKHKDFLIKLNRPDDDKKMHGNDAKNNDKSS
jgi:hypothetical protein